MLDKKSYTILTILQEKARIPNTEVARQVGLAPSAVLERIRKLEAQGYIDGYEVRLNPEKFSRDLVAFITVFVDLNADCNSAIGKQLAAMEEIQEVHYIAGDDAYFVKVRVKDTQELNTILRTSIATIEGVTKTQTATVLDTHKETARIPLR